MTGGDERGGVVGDDGGGVRGKAIEDVVRLGATPAERKDVADVERAERALGFGHTLEDERVEPVVGVRIRAGEPFVIKQRKIQFVGELRGVEEGVVRVHAAVHPRPVEDVTRAEAHGRGNQDSDTVLQVHKTHVQRQQLE